MNNTQDILNNGSRLIIPLADKKRKSNNFFQEREESSIIYPTYQQLEKISQTCEKIRSKICVKLTLHAMSDNYLFVLGKKKQKKKKRKNEENEEEEKEEE